MTRVSGVEAFEGHDALLEAIAGIWSGAGEEANVYDLLPVWSVAMSHGYDVADHRWGVLTVLAWWGILDLIELEGAEDVVIDGDLEVTERRVVTGNLRIRGDLSLDTYAFYDPNDKDALFVPQLIVFGDLIVEGGWKYDGAVVLVGGDIIVHGVSDENSEWSLVVTGGSFRSGAAVVSSGELHVGRDLCAPVVSLTYNHGYSIVCGRIVACMCVVTDHGRSWTGETPEVGAPYMPELEVGERGYFDVTDTAMVEALRSVLLEEVFEDVLGGATQDGDYWFFEDYEEIFFREILEDLSARVCDHGVGAVMRASALEPYVNGLK